MKCKACSSSELYVVAEAGVGQNVRCNKCGSLHINSPLGFQLIRSGSPKPTVRYPGGGSKEFDTNEEAYEEAKSWNRLHSVRPGAYVIDDEGVMATDPLNPIV